MTLIIGTLMVLGWALLLATAERANIGVEFAQDFLAIVVGIPVGLLIAAWWYGAFKRNENGGRGG